MTIRPMEDRETPVVELVGSDGNAFAVIGKVRRAMRSAGWTTDEIGEATHDMMAGDYDHLLGVVVDCCEVS